MIISSFILAVIFLYIINCFRKQEIERLNGNNQAMQEEMARTWKKLDEKENIIKEVREYIKKDTRWFDSEYASIYGELCDCAGANDTRLEVLVNPSNLLKILDKEVN